MLKILETAYSERRRPLSLRSLSENLKSSSSQSGLFFLLHRKTLFERTLGAAVALGGIVGIFVSGSRGGFVGVITSVAVFVTFYSIRKAVSSRGSLVPAIAGLLGVIGFGCVIGAIMLSHSVHDMVLGGAAQASSTDARYLQWAAGYPSSSQIRSPATVSGWEVKLSDMGQIDSYVLSLVLETGVPGLVFFVGLLRASGLVWPTELSLRHVGIRRVGRRIGL